VEFEYRTQQDKRRELSVPFMLDEDLVVRRYNVSFDRAIGTRILDADGEPVITRNFDPSTIERKRDGSVFYESIDVNTLALTAPADYRMVREGRYFVATQPDQRFDGYQLTVAPIRSETEQQATAALLEQDGEPTTGAVEIDNQDLAASDYLSNLTLSSASFDFDGSFSIDLPLDGEPDEYAGWGWMLAGPSVFFGFQREVAIEVPRYDLLIPLPSIGGLAKGKGKKVPYDVSESALLNRPEIFADDPGLACRPFDNPGRILGERRFNTILRITQPDNDESGSAVGRFVDNPRQSVSGSNPIDWEDDTTKYQARTVSRGHIVEFRVRWRSNGYSLGDVAHSLTLAPRQTRRIVKVDFERRERAVRREETVSSDELEQATIRDRDYSDAVASSLSEWSRGGSKASVTGAAGGFGIAGPGFVIGGGAAHGSSSASSWQRGGRNVSAAEQQSLRDSIRQYGDSLRSIESTVVTEAEQDESVEGVSEIVRNINYCHALSIVYYEILRHLRVDTEVGGVRECLFIPLSINKFDDDRILKHRQVLQRYVRNRDQRNALRNVSDILDDFQNSEIPAGARNEQNLTYLTGRVDLQLSITRPQEGEVAAEVEEGTRREFSETERYRKLVEKYEPYAFFLPKAPSEIVHDLHNVTESERDRYFQRNIAPHMARQFANQLKLGTESNGSFKELDADFTLAGGYRYGRTARVDFTVDLDEDVQRLETETLIVKGNEDFSLPAQSVANVRRGRISFATDHYRRRNVYSDRGMRDLLKSDGEATVDGAELRFPFSRYELANVRNELMKAYDDVKRDLNQDLYRYHKAIWWNMDRDALYTLLDGFAGDEDGRSIASLVERRPIGILGNTLVFRVSAGTLLDPNFESPEALVDYYRTETSKSDPLRVSLPTSGLYARAHMDDCLACEEHQGTLDWVLDNPEPELSDLPASLLESRRSQPTGLTPTEFPDTLINLQNAPTAPAPAGLQDILRTVGSSGAFRDMAGLSETQKSAVAGLQTAANLATAFGKNALTERLADIASDGNAPRNVAAMAESLKNAVDKKMISEDAAEDSLKNFINKMTKGSSADAPEDVAESTKELASGLGEGGSATMAAANREGASFASFTGGTPILDPSAGMVGSFVSLGRTMLASRITGWKQSIPPIAETEYTFWATDSNDPDAGRRTEGEALTNSEYLDRLKAYYRGVNPNASEATVTSRANDYADNDLPWSAAFVSYVMREAGVEEPRDGFKFYASHSVFVTQGLVNRLNRDYAKPFWTYRYDEVPVAVGDIIAKGRGANQIEFDEIFFREAKKNDGSWVPALVFENGVWEWGEAEYLSHSDIVIEIVKNENDTGNDYAYTIGGNTEHLTGTEDTVGKKKYLLNEGGYVRYEVYDESHEDVANDPEINAGDEHEKSSPYAVVKMLDRQLDDWALLERKRLSGEGLDERDSLIEVFSEETVDALEDLLKQKDRLRRLMFPEATEEDASDVDRSVPYSPLLTDAEVPSDGENDNDAGTTIV
jgi:hypothetical protein